MEEFLLVKELEFVVDFFVLINEIIVEDVWSVFEFLKKDKKKKKKVVVLFWVDDEVLEGVVVLMSE